MSGAILVIDSVFCLALLCGRPASPGSKVLGKAAFTNLVQDCQGRHEIYVWYGSSTAAALTAILVISLIDSSLHE